VQATRSDYEGRVVEEVGKAGELSERFKGMVAEIRAKIQAQDEEVWLMIKILTGYYILTRGLHLGNRQNERRGMSNEQK
jgi:hypothetical protein